MCSEDIYISIFFDVCLRPLEPYTECLKFGADVAREVTNWCLVAEKTGKKIIKI